MSVLIAVGANCGGHRGTPRETLRWVLARLPQFGLSVNRVSSFYATAPIGATGQSDYVNGVASIATALPAAALLRVLKQLELEAGRQTERLRTAPRWDSRPLDLDIIDYKGLVTAPGAASIRVPQGWWPLQLPHPQATVRPFVIRPLLDVAPLWHHPVTRRSAAQLWARLRDTADGRIISRLD
jgi:2-amino-4-hydroxy-6-hydroxymethyldihydropteridine diphosphokinase